MALEPLRGGTVHICILTESPLSVDVAETATAAYLPHRCQSFISVIVSSVTKTTIYNTGI